MRMHYINSLLRLTLTYYEHCVIVWTGVCVCSNTGSVQWVLSDLRLSNTYNSTAQPALSRQCQKSVDTLCEL